LAQDKPHELIVQSLLRAQFSERLARLAGFSTPQHWFMMGLFSLLDALLDRTIEYALQQIRVARPVEDALLGNAPSGDRLAIVYALIRGYESGDWETVTRLADSLGVPAGKVADAYVESARWVASVSGTGA
jgi:EAL and modified HD-GYP domain-containing signal transduction protein